MKDPAEGTGDGALFERDAERLLRHIAIRRALLGAGIHERYREREPDQEVPADPGVASQVEERQERVQRPGGLLAKRPRGPSASAS